MDTFLDDLERSADAESGLMFMDRIGFSLYIQGTRCGGGGWEWWEVRGSICWGNG